MKNVKIFVSHHKDGKIIKTNLIEPIQVGASLNKVSLNMIKDNKGDNISQLNDKFCELTAQYWAWKNTNYDYYGFMHYRRHFVFNDIPEVPDDGGLLHFPQIDEEYIKKIGLNDESIQKSIEDVDIILPPAVDLSGWCAPSNEIQFCGLNNLHAKDFATVCDVVVELYPEYKNAVERFRKGHYVYWYNMFIMKKDIFFEYCDWLFSILELSNRKIDYTGYDSQEKRSLAFMAERLLSIFILYKNEEDPNLVIKHKKITFVHNTDDILVGKTEKQPEKNLEFIDILSDSLKKAVRELRSEQLLPATDEQGLNDSGVFFEKMQKCNIIMYGAGNYGKRIIDMLTFLGMKTPYEIWDSHAEEKSDLCGLMVSPPNFETAKYDNTIVIISIANKEISKEISKKFEMDGAKTIVSKDEFMKHAVNLYWYRLCNE